MANTIIVIPEEDFPSVGGCEIPPSPNLDYSIHNNLRMIQGGEEDQRYHVDINEYLAIHDANSPSQSNVFATFADLTTDNVVEGSNLYFTQARVRSTLLTGFVVGANTPITSADTVLSAFGKTQGQINARVPLTRVINVGPDLTGGGSLANDITIGFAPRNNAWINDQAGAPRLYFGTSTTSTNLLLRLSNPIGDFSIRDSANVDIFTVSSNGTLTTGIVPWARLIDHVSITAGNGLTGGGILSATRTVTLGTPSTITGSTTNSVTSNSHTHELTLVSADITGALGFNPVTDARTITAGNGLTGGGNLTADRTIVLGTPSNITLASTNSVTATSHTHAFLPGGTTVQYIRGDGTLATFPNIPQGTVTSVGMSVPSALLSVSGSPITTSGTFAVTLPARASNLVFAGPASGANAAPTFRSLVADDIPNLDAAKISTGTLADARIPNLNASKITAGVLATARLGSGTASTSTYLRGDGSWAALPSSGVTSIVIGNGLTGSSPITSTGTITMGTPGTLTGTTTNATTASSHTHEISLTAADVGAVPVARLISTNTGSHLTGGGNLGSNRAISLRPDVGIYINDSQGNPRMVFGSTDLSEYNNFVFRLSLSNGRYQFMDSAGNPIMFIGPGGTISYAKEQVSGTTVNMGGAPLKLMSDITVDTEYNLTQREVGQNIQLFVRNVGASPVTVTIFGAILLGGNIIGPGKRAAISVQNTDFDLPNLGTFYVVKSEI